MLYNPDESIVNIKKYLKRLTNIIETKSSLTLIKIKLVDKSSIDDILCCIEASFPDDYKDFLKKSGGKALQSYSYYRMLKEKIQNKFPLSTSHYAVRYKEAIPIIITLAKSFESDFKRIFNNG